MMGISLLSMSPSSNEHVTRSRFVADTQIDLGETCPCGCVEGEVEEESNASTKSDKEKDKKVVIDVERLSPSFQGRLAVCASGPCSLTQAASNAVARLSGRRKGVEVDLHTEVYAM